MVFSDTMVTLFYWQGMKVLAPLLGLLTSPWWGDVGCSSREGKKLVPYLAFFYLSGVEPQCFLWCLAGGKWLLSKILLSCEAAPFLVLWLNKENRLFFFVGVFFSALLALSFWVASLITCKSQIQKAKGKPRELGTVLFLSSQGP